MERSALLVFGVSHEDNLLHNQKENRQEDRGRAVEEPPKIDLLTL